jgi:hypothetical protein
MPKKYYRVIIWHVTLVDQLTPKKVKYTLRFLQETKTDSYENRIPASLDVVN